MFPFSAQLSLDEYAGPVFGEKEATQVFVAKRPVVSRIQFVSATYMRSNTQDVLVSIENEEQKISETAVNASLFPDNGWVMLDIPPAFVQMGREYRLRIRSPQSTPSNAIAIRYSPAGTGCLRRYGTLWRNGTHAVLTLAKRRRDRVYPHAPKPIASPIRSGSKPSRLPFHPCTSMPPQDVLAL